MLGELNLSSMFPNMLFPNIRPLCGLFGLYGLEVKPKTLAEFSKPFDYIRAKKIIENHFFLSGL
jgi:hypothetical protein